MSGTPKIAYLTGEYPRATDTFIQREVAALRRLGIEINTCSIRTTGPEHHVGEEQRAEAARTFNVLAAARNPLRFFRAHFGAIARGPLRYLRGLSLAWRTAPKGLRGRIFNLIYFAEAVVLAAHLRQIGARHLHNHIAKSSCTVAMLASAVSGVPFSFTLHGPDIFYDPMHWRLDEKIARASFVACISEFCRAQAMNFSNRAHWGKLHIVHCGVDPALYTAGKRGGDTLLFVGRLAAVKGLPVLFEALDTLPDLRLKLVGDGPERRELEREAEARGLTGRVEFLGYTSQGEVAALLATSDALVLPSFAEGLPVVLMEALAAKLPVIATRVAGVGELVEDGKSGRLVAAGSAPELESAIREVMSNAALRKRMGAAGRARVEADFDSDKEAAKLAKQLREVQP